MNKKIFSKISIIKYVIVAVIMTFTIYYAYQFIHYTNEFNKIVEYNNTLNSSINELNQKYYSLTSQAQSLTDEKDLYEDMSESAETAQAKSELLNSTYVLNDELYSLIDKVDTIYTLNNKNKNNNYNVDEYKELFDEVKTSVTEQSEAVDNLLETKEDKANLMKDLEDLGEENKFPNAKTLVDSFNNTLDYIFPIGSIYISADGTTPEIGQWEKLQTGIVLWNTDDGGELYLAPTLPNIKGSPGANVSNYASVSGPFYAASSGSSKKSSGGSYSAGQLYMNLHNANPIYQDDATVRPPSFAVTIYKRIG